MKHASSSRQANPRWWWGMHFLRYSVRLTIFWTIAFLGAVSGQAGETSRWWPVQAMPRGIVRTEVVEKTPAGKAGMEMLVQSVAGLAAKAVNENRGDTMVWVNNGNVDLEQWYHRMFELHPALKKLEAIEPW